MPAKSEAIFSVRDQDAVAALNRMYAAADKAESKLKELDAAATGLGDNKGLAKFATAADAALKAFDTKIDGSKRKIGELKAALDELHNKEINIEVAGVDRALAEVIALKAAISGLDGKSVSLPSEIMSALPSGYANAMSQTRDIRLSSLFSATKPLQVATSGGSSSTTGGAFSYGQMAAGDLQGQLDRLTTEIRKANEANAGVRSGSGVPGPVRTSYGGGGGGGGGGLLGMAMMAAPVLPGLLQAVGGLGAVLGGGVAAGGLGMAALAPAYASGMAGAGLLKLGTQPLMAGVTGAGSYLQQQQMAATMAPVQLAAMQQQSAVQNQAQLAGMRAVGLGPGTAQYEQAATQMAFQAQQQQLQFQLQQQQQKTQARAQFVAQMQNIGVDPAMALNLANQVQGIQTEFGRTMTGGARGAQQMRVANRALGFARGPGMSMIGNAYDPFANVAERAVGRQGGGGLLGFLGSAGGKDQVQQTADALAGIAGPLTTIAGEAGKLGMTLTRDIAPFTMQLEGSLAGKLGSANEWAGSAKGITEINSAFSSAKPVWGAMAGFIEAVGKGFDHLLTGGGGAAAASMLNDMSRNVPGLVDWMNRGTGVLPGLTSEFGALLRALKPIFDSEGLLPTALPILRAFTDLFGTLTHLIGGPASSALLGGAALAMRGRGGGGLLSALIPGAGLLGLGGKGGAKAAASEEKGLFSAIRSAIGPGEGTWGGVGTAALSTATGFAPAIGLTGALLAMSQPKGSTGGLLSGIISGATAGGLAGVSLPLPGADLVTGAIGAVLGGLGGAAVNLFGGQSKGKKPTPPPIQFGAAATSQDLLAYLNQTFSTPGTPGTPGRMEVVRDKLGYMKVKPGTLTPEEHWVPGTPGTPRTFEGYGIPMAGVGKVAGMTDAQVKQEQIQAQQAFHALQANTAQQVVALGGIMQQLHQANLSGEQRRSLLQQMAQTNAGSVNYNRFGQAVSVNQGNMRLLMGMTHHGIAGARELGHTQGALLGQRGHLESAINSAVHAAPAGLKGALESALYSGDPNAIEAISAQAPHNAALRAALKRYAAVAAGGNIQQVNQELQGINTAFLQLTPAQRLAETRASHEHPTAARAAATGGGTNVTASAAARSNIHSRLRGPGGGTVVSASASPGGSTVGHSIQNVGLQWAHQLATGMDSQKSFAAIDDAAKGVLKEVLGQWGNADAITGSTQAGFTLVQDFAQGLKGGMQGSPGDLINQTMWTLGFNIALQVAGGALAGAQGGGGNPKGGGGGGGANAGKVFTPGGKSGLSAIAPQGSAVGQQRRDQGQDLTVTKGGKPGVIIAWGDGHCVSNGYNPTGFGTDYPIVHYDTGPDAGHDVYIGHCKSLLRPGQKFKKGQAIAQTQHGQGGLSGNARTPGWAEIGLAPGGVPGEWGQTLPGVFGSLNQTETTGAVSGGGGGDSEGGLVGPAAQRARAAAARHGSPPRVAAEHGAAVSRLTRGGLSGGRPVTVHVHMHDVKLTGGKAEFDKFMNDFTTQVERAMHTAVKVVSP